MASREESVSGDRGKHRSMARRNPTPRRGSRHLALVAEARDQPVEPVSGRPGLVAEGQALIFSRELGNELACCRLRGGELPEIAHLAPTSALGNCHCITRFRRIDPDESFASLMGPVMSSLPVRQTPGSASVDGHSSFPLQERSCPMGRGCNICSPNLAQPVTCFSPWSAQRLPA